MNSVLQAETSLRAIAEPRSAPNPPWWRVGMVWLVLGGPFVVVVAALVTAVIAIQGAEPVLPAESGPAFADRPALQGRNHAASPQPAQ